MESTVSTCRLPSPNRASPCSRPCSEAHVVRLARMNRLSLLAIPLLLAACITSQRPGQPVAKETPPPPWVFLLDRDGLVLDGARVGVKDKDAFKRALHAHWGQEPILEVSPDVPVITVGWVRESARLAKLQLLKVRNGTFSWEF